MPMMLLLAGVAQAGTAVWLSGTPDPEITPGHTPMPVSEVGAPPVFADADAAVVRSLLDEHTECTAMLDEFDGELAIIRRLDAALDQVELLRISDADLVWKALLLQGLAIHRYFPDLGTAEAAGAGVGRPLGGRNENRAWADAIALLPDRQPRPAELGDEAARLAYQEQRARALMLPPGEISVNDRPPGAVLLVDGIARRGDLAPVVPGRHRASLEVGGAVQMRTTVTVAPDEARALPYAAVSHELAALAPTLTSTSSSVGLPPAVLARLQTLPTPVFLVVQGERGPRVFEVRDGSAEPTDASPAARPARGENGPQLTVSVAGGWVYDGDYLLQNASDGAPEDPATVNAGAPVLGVAGELPIGPMAAGVGVDLLLPLGDFHSLPSGDNELRLRAHPHVAVGAGPVRATVGWWTPWHLGVGARARLPVTERFGVVGAYVHGIGIQQERDAGGAFEPGASRVGWLGADIAFR